MNWTIIISTCVTAIATVAIAIYAYLSYQLTSEINYRDDKYREQFSQLLKAIATSNLLATGDMPGSTRMMEKTKQFNRWNEGVYLTLPE
jgi:hypothetical protein